MKLKLLSLALFGSLMISSELYSSALPDEEIFELNHNHYIKTVHSIFHNTTKFNNNDVPFLLDALRNHSTEQLNLDLNTYQNFISDFTPYPTYDPTYKKQHPTYFKNIEHLFVEIAKKLDGINFEQQSCKKQLACEFDYYRCISYYVSEHYSEKLVNKIYNAVETIANKETEKKELLEKIKNLSEDFYHFMHLVSHDLNITETEILEQIQEQDSELYNNIQNFITEKDALRKQEQEQSRLHYIEYSINNFKNTYTLLLASFITKDTDTENPTYKEVSLFDMIPNCDYKDDIISRVREYINYIKTQH